MKNHKIPTNLGNGIEGRLASSKNVSFTIFVIIVGSLFIRIFYFPHDVPLILDALVYYFFYAMDTSVLGHLSNDVNFGNIGWPIFLSFFFTIFQFDTVFEYMTLQRVISISLSLLTVIPIYFLCNKFFEKKYSILGAMIFAFEPRIIQNSLLGITEPLYILLVTISLVFFFSEQKIINYISFALVALATIVRVEGLFLFVPLFILFLIKKRREKFFPIHGLMVLTIFVLVLTPMVFFKMDTLGVDGFVSSAQIHADRSLQNYGEGIFFTNFYNGAQKALALGGWSLFPIFILPVPIGFFLVFKKENRKLLPILVIITSMITAALFAFSIAPDTRYIYPLFPLFCLLFILAIKKLECRVKNPKIFFILLIMGILISSGFYLDLKSFDYDHQRESFSLAKKITLIAQGINDYYPEDSYIISALIPEHGKILSSSILMKTRIFSTNEIESLDEYIIQNEGLTHLVLDGNENRPTFLNDVFYNEKKYPYLTKEFDSIDQGYNYHFKIFKIDREKISLSS